MMRPFVESSPSEAASALLAGNPSAESLSMDRNTCRGPRLAPQLSEPPLCALMTFTARLASRIWVCILDPFIGLLARPKVVFESHFEPDGTPGTAVALLPVCYIFRGLVCNPSNR